VPRVVDRVAAGAARPPAVVVRRSDGPGEWVVAGEPVATVTAGGPALVAWLSGRGWSVDPRDLAVDGDRAAAMGLPDRVAYV
jgi:hypothetical protein